MGDTDAQVSENISEPKLNAPCDTPKSSIDVLKESKPSENIAISEPEGGSNDSSTDAVVKSTVNEPLETADLKKAGEPANEKNDKIIVHELKHDTTGTDTLKDVSAAHKANEKASLKNRSDIFSLNGNKNVPATIFSVGGAPSKTIHPTSSGNSNQTSCSNDMIGPVVSNQSQFRNPLTGIGVSSNDEFKNKPTKRRDGNPLLGVGYKDDKEFFSTPTTQRIPPGGYSKGLW